MPSKIKAAIGGAIRGATKGLIGGFQIGSDIQRQRLAEQIAAEERGYKREMEQREEARASSAELRAKTGFSESREQQAMERVKAIADQSVGPDWSSLTPDQQRPVFERMFMAIQREDSSPTEAVRNVGVVASVIKEVERTKKEARDLERIKMDLQRNKSDSTMEKQKPLTGEALIKASMWQSVGEDSARASALAEDLGFATTGPFQGRITNVKAFFNSADPRALELRTILNRIRGTIARAQAGTTFTEGERKLLESYTATTTSPDMDLKIRLNEMERGSKDYLRLLYEAAAIPLPANLQPYSQARPQEKNDDPLGLRIHGSGQP